MPRSSKEAKTKYGHDPESAAADAAARKLKPEGKPATSDFDPQDPAATKYGRSGESAAADAAARETATGDNGDGDETGDGDGDGLRARGDLAV